MEFRLLGPLRDDLIRHMLATSEERASIVDELTWRNPAMATYSSISKGGDDLRAKQEETMLGGRVLD